MFNELNDGWNLNRYSAELNGFYVMVQLAKADSRYGIANGKITRLLVYPYNPSPAKGKIVVFDRGWNDGVPDQKDIRKVIEETVRFFDGISINWDLESSKRTTAICIG